jgi:hypothetical protein
MAALSRRALSGALPVDYVTRLSLPLQIGSIAI